MSHESRNQRSHGFAAYQAALAVLLSLASLAAAAAQTGREPDTAAAREPERIEIGSAVESSLEAADPTLPGKGRYRVFRLVAGKSAKLTIRLESRQFDAYLLVRDQDGTTIAEDNDSGPGDNAQALFEAEAGKEYAVLAVSGVEEGSGELKLEVREEAPEKLTSGQELLRDLAWYETVEKAEISIVRKGEILRSMGRCHLELGAPTRAMEVWEKALEFARMRKDRRSEGSLLEQLGKAHGDLGQSEKAIELYESALEIHREMKNRHHEGTALGNLGNAHGALGNPERAIELYEKALEIHRETKNSRDEGRVLGGLGNRYSELGQPEKAIEIYEKALEIHRQTKDRRGESSVLGNLGSRHNDLGRPEKAIEYYEMALEISRETKDRRVEGLVLGNLGNRFSDLGRPEKAIEYYETALEIHRETKDRRSEGRVLGNLGLAYGQFGQMVNAIEYYERALEIHRETKDRRNEGRVLGNLGVAYGDLGQPQKAIELFDKVLEILRQTRDRALEGRVLGNLGVVHGELGHINKAIAYYTKALEIHRETKDRRFEGTILKCLGVAYDDLGEPVKAIGYYTQAQEIHRETRDRRSEGRLLRLLGNSYSKLGQLDRAIELYEAALQILRDTRSTSYEAMAFWDLGRAQAQRGVSALAHEAFRSAYAIDIDILAGVERGLEESAYRSLASATFQRGVVDYFELLVKLFRSASSPEEKQVLLAEVLNLVEGFRARTFTSALRAGEIRGLLSPEGMETWSRLRAAKEKVANTLKGSFEGLPGEGKERDEALAKLHGEIQHHENEIASLERRLKGTEPKLASLFASSRGVSPEQIPGILGDGEVLLHYNLVGKNVAVLVGGGRQGLGLQTLDLDSEKLRAEVDELLLDLRPRDGKLKPVPDLKKRLKTLRQDLLGGLEETLEGARGIVVIPDGCLHLFPFEALVLEDGSYLVEKLGVRYAPSLQVLLELNRREEREARVSLVLFGDPEFGDLPGNTEEPAIALRVRGGSGFTRLKHAREEVDKLGALFDEKVVRRGGEATEASFKAESPRGTLLHVVTHGRFAQAGGTDAQSFFYSGLAFSGCNRGGDGIDDGFLSAAEVMGLDLRAVDLAVLSACETAAGAVRPQEGKMGLERAFFLAGVKTFVGSLWQVDDRAAAEFMGKFYRCLLEGKTKPQALRQAKLDFILLGRKEHAEATTRGERGIGLAPKPARDSSHPYYWAPFVLSGDARGGLRRE